jgi:hypothetical protein
MNRLVPALAAAVLTAATASVALPSPPSAANSHLDPCLVFCPGGDIAFQVIVRDLSNNPIANASVALDFSACPLYAHCPDPGPGIVANDAAHTLTKVTDAQGQASFGAWVGGICGNAAVRIFADGVLLGTRTLASPDQDGNLVVDQADFLVIQNAIGTTDGTKDLDCSGAVAANDVTLATSHRAHSCLGPTPARSQSWGTLKIRYR